MRYIRLNLQKAQGFLSAHPRRYELHPDKLKAEIHRLPLLSGSYPIQVASDIISPLPLGSMGMIPQEGFDIGFFTDSPQWDTKRHKWALILESSPGTFHSHYQIVLRMQN
jgi:hypothetical protein